ncbi:MAG: hypothetical protein RLZZ362_486 [Actinomycetota bacterium]|jgi:RNA polymerase sigma-70 factor (ECF subfamily)
MSNESDQEDRFRAAYSAHTRALLADAARRCVALPDAADIVADTMLVAWRRIDAMPPEPETRLWLFGVARNVLNNHRRGHRRSERLGQRLRQELHEQSQTVELADGDTARLVQVALQQLKPLEREVMLLTIGEQLTPSEIAVVLELNSSTVRTHLQRARTKVRAHVEGSTVTAQNLRRNSDDGHEAVEAHPAPQLHGPEEVTR